MQRAEAAIFEPHSDIFYVAGYQVSYFTTTSFLMSPMVYMMDFHWGLQMTTLTMNIFTLFVSQLYNMGYIEHKTKILTIFSGFMLSSWVYAMVTGGIFSPLILLLPSICAFTNFQSNLTAECVVLLLVAYGLFYFDFVVPRDSVISKHQLDIIALVALIINATTLVKLAFGWRQLRLAESNMRVVYGSNRQSHARLELETLLMCFLFSLAWTLAGLAMSLPLFLNMANVVFFCVVSIIAVFESSSLLNAAEAKFLMYSLFQMQTALFTVCSGTFKSPFFSNFIFSALLSPMSMNFTSILLLICIYLFHQFKDHFLLSGFNMGYFPGLNLLNLLCLGVQVLFYFRPEVLHNISSHLLSMLCPARARAMLSQPDGVSGGLSGISEHLYINTEQKLGEGGGGSVYQGLYKGEKVAVKLITSTGEFIKEISIYQNFKSPYIVKYLGYCWDTEADRLTVATSLYLIMEFCDGTLRRELINKQQSLTPEICLAHAVAIARGLSYLHTEKVIHRDLKSDNVLLLNGHCKLTDFGSSSKHSDTLRADSLCEVRGTLVYLAPEMSIERFQVSYSSDIYSFGIVLWEIFNTLAVKTYQTPYHTLMPSLRKSNNMKPDTANREPPVRELKLDDEESSNHSDDHSGACPCPSPMGRHVESPRKKRRSALMEGNQPGDACEVGVEEEHVLPEEQDKDDAKIDYALFVLIANGTRPDVPKNFLKRAMALYVNCVGSDPRNRPKCGDVLRHLESWQKYLTAKIANSGHVRHGGEVSPQLLSSSSGSGSVGGWDEVTAQEVVIRLPPVSEL